MTVTINYNTYLMLYAHNIVYRVCQCGPKPKINVHVAKNKSTLCRITTLSRKKNDKIEMVATKNVNMYIYAFSDETWYCWYFSRRSYQLSKAIIYATQFIWSIHSFNLSSIVWQSLIGLYIPNNLPLYNSTLKESYIIKYQI